jgi:trehalose synthase
VSDGTQLVRTSDAWWKNAFFYCLDVETFQDGNGDGCGDFAGLAERVDYLAGLGVDCIWLMPFYPSPNRDDGYDICDYYDVDERLGDLGQFVEFVRIANDRGIKVIADLVVNHTSSQHPWFQKSRRREEPFSDFYVWRDRKPKDGPKGLIFPGEQEEIWTYDRARRQYYLHRFYKEQPDLNIASEQVRHEIRKIVGFWLQLGLAGFRVDAVPFLIETKGIKTPGDLEPHGVLRNLRELLNIRRGNAMMLGEVNLEPKDVRRFFGDEDGDELHMCLNFNLNQAVALALVRGLSAPIEKCLKALIPLPRDAQWGNFVRNHDEWSLDKLTEHERQEVFAAFGPEEKFQLFGRGLRRRLPTMLDGDQARIRMAYGLTFALPGAPVLFYGEEIGMAENLAIRGRLSVRAPMQWSSGANGGFSTAPATRLHRPVVDGAYGPEHVNVEDQSGDEHSLLNWMERLIRARKAAPEIGHGDWSLLDSGHDAVLALRYDWDGRTVVVTSNLAAEPATVTISTGRGDRWSGYRPLFGDAEVDLLKTQLRIALPPYGSCWVRAHRATDAIRR